MYNYDLITLTPFDCTYNVITSCSPKLQPYRVTVIEYTVPCIYHVLG